MRKKIFSIISVYDKTNLEKICNLFNKYNIEIISTGSTAKHIKKIGYQCHTVSKFTKFAEILNGRVKTLHPLIHASLLFNRKNKIHTKLFKTLNFPEISFVIVNLYPFEKTIKTYSNINKCLDMIDIGGHTLLRSAAKNFHSITAISKLIDYDAFIKNMTKNKGKTTLIFRKKMAANIFELTSTYDQLISGWINQNKNNIKMINHEKNILRYGENPHQKSYFYNNKYTNSFLKNIISNNKQLSFNNISDANAALECINDFSEPTCVIIKHNMPCGVASDSKINRAFLKAYDSDSVSAFGGIVALNRRVDEKISHSLLSKFFEIIIAPSFSIKSKKIFKLKKRLILIETKNINKDKKPEIKSIFGGYIMQEKNTIVFSKNKMKCVSGTKATDNQIKDLIFAFKVCKYIKSNAIVLVQNKKTIGIGAGQTSRIDSTKISLSKLSSKYKKSGFVAASDAYFPFLDNIKLLIKNNCKAIIQPKGSINDYKIINFANSKKLPLYFSNYRFFKH